MSQTWVFRQIEGVNRKTFVLSGYAAPFGRPRKDPVIKEVIKSRVQTTRYPGSGAAPTRHVFGTDWEDSDLKGRWATKNLEGLVSASDMADQWTDFVRDERLVEMSWGNIVSYQVFISELELARESEDEIAWKMHVLIDKRNEGVASASRPPVNVSLIDNTEAALESIVALADLQIPSDLQDGLGFFDSLSLLIGALNSYPALLNNLVNQVGAIETATFGALNALRAGIKGIQTTVISARELASTLTLDSVNFVQSAKSDLQMSTWQSAFDIESDVLLEILADLDRKAELGSRGDASKVVTADSEDTWESLSTKAKGGPDFAGVLRAANGARYGERPVAGTVYQVP